VVPLIFVVGTATGAGVVMGLLLATLEVDEDAAATETSAEVGTDAAELEVALVDAMDPVLDALELADVTDAAVLDAEEELEEMTDMDSLEDALEEVADPVVCAEDAEDELEDEPET